MQINEETIKLIAKQVINAIEARTAAFTGDSCPKIPLEVSARHIHLSQDSADALFGKGYKLKLKKELLQPGEYLAEERVTLIGPRGVLENVAVLGPIRPKTQIELAPSDARKIGIKAPVKDSGDVSGTPGVMIASSTGMVKLDQGVMLARRHIHMTPADAQCFNLKDKDIVKVRMKGFRPLVFDDVLVRVSEKFALAMHIDTDEAGASGADGGTEIEIVKDSCCQTKNSAVNVVEKDVSGSNAGASVKDKLITEARMKELAASGAARITVPCRTIITSLAMDYARSRKIEIIKGKT